MRRPLIWASLAAAMHTALASASGPLGVLYVDDDAPEGGDGLSWQTAFRDLQDALDAARCLDPVEIRVADGIYVPSGSDSTPRGRFLVDAIRGGCGILLDPPEFGSATDETPHFYMDESRGSYPHLSQVVFSIRGAFAGLARPETPDLQDPTEFTSILSGDRNGNDQPGFRNRADNCDRVLEIHAALGNETLLIEHFEISGAGGWGSDANHGGGVYISATSGGVSLNHCTIRSNAADEWGGGAFVAGGHLSQFYRCVFSENESVYGGALRVHGRTNIVHCEFTSNDAGWGGAVSNVSGANLVKSIFRQNHANYGGAIEGVANAYGCLFLENEAADGGSIFGPRCTLYNCTVIQGNAPDTDICVDGTAAFKNCILVTTSDATMVRAFFIEFWTSMVDNDQTAFELLGGELDWQGSLVAPPRFIDPPNDFRPGPGSAALDAGARTHHCFDLLDAADLPRFVDAVNYADTGEQCRFDRAVMDLGAFEAPADTPRLCNADWNNDESVDINDAIAFIGDFDSQNLGADLNTDGMWDFYDLQLFLRAFAAGCP